MQSLLYSRKFWLAVYGLIQTIALYYLSVPSDILIAADVLVMVLIGSIAAEDAAMKRAGGGALSK